MSKRKNCPFMVEIRLNAEVEQIWPVLDEQFKNQIEKYCESGQIYFLSSSKDYSRHWLALNCECRQDLLFLLDNLDIIKFSTYNYTEIAQVESTHELPVVCLN